MEEITDKERLDWLQNQTEGYGNGWIVRKSLTGRGFRLHESSSEEASASVREAIDKAIQAEKVDV